MPNKKFSERIKAERLKRGLSQDALAEILNIQKTRICMWETQGTVPRQDMLLRLCEYFGVSADYLLGNDEKTNNPNDEIINGLQRGFSKLNPEDLKKAQNILKAVFSDAFGGD